MVFVTWYVEGKLLQVRVASLRLLQVRVLPGVREGHNTFEQWPLLACF